MRNGKKRNSWHKKVEKKWFRERRWSERIKTSPF